MPAEQRIAGVIEEIAAERQRQVDVEGWDDEHDDQHGAGELSLAAVCYALPFHDRTGPAWNGQIGISIDLRRLLWPWDAGWWKPKDRRRGLVRAAALIVAEIERLDRCDAGEQREPTEEM